MVRPTCGPADIVKGDSVEATSTVEKRWIIDAGLARGLENIKKGCRVGPFKTADENDCFDESRAEQESQH
jgi:hypothetical protein